MHDDCIVTYSVNLEEKVLVIQTYNNTQKKHRKICFYGVLTHSFKCIIDYNIIADIKEYEINNFIIDNQEELRKMEKENMVMLAIAHGSIAMGQKGRLKLMDYWSTTLPAAPAYIPLEISSLDHVRFTACFLPDIRFTHVAPNLGILCYDKQRGPIILRQGNYLACNYVAELTKKTYLYDYWLEMVLSAKMT